MQKLNLETAQKFAEENFGKMDEMNHDWNILHARHMVRALEELAEGQDFDLEKLRTLAWVHDIGKTEQDKDHAEISLKILEKHFELDDTDRDAIRHHGSSGEPTTAEGKIFQTADGISLFYPETIFFRFFGESKEGSSFEEIVESIRDQYEKYLDTYKDSPKAVEILKSKYERYFLGPIVQK